MKKLAAVISTTLLLASASANAQFYLGAKAGASWLNDSCSTGPCDDSSWALGSFAGYEFSDMISLEIGLDTLGETTGYGYTDAGLSSYSFAPRLTMPIAERLDAFAKLGGAYVEYGDKDDSSLLGALGITYSFMPTIDFQLEYQRLTDINVDTHRFKGNALTLGFIAKFGGSDEAVEQPVEEELMVEEVVVVEPIIQTFETKVVDSSSFALNSAELKPQSKTMLADLVTFMTKFPQSTVEVVGYTDSSGSASYNQKLSEKRAQSVAEVLQEQGIDSSRITARGEGENNPIASNETREGREQNRRVEIMVPAFEYQAQ
ncbi:OmpA family protein [Vibrio sp. T11.5]|uniref:OmpA family protein n=1 Tax=Vibrio sp. T11.5 TaxID=2998836 RepID=UPI0022CD6810|nr:OmpA family protein [Vibrio sp. T11.5]MDA0119409.1 OmpA family protein [Vibrio sp. T11.5]